MQCSECGSSLTLNATICPDCGASQLNTPPIRTRKPTDVSKKLVAEIGNASAKNTLPKTGDIFAGRYRIEKYLGLGSLCNAYLCRDSAEDNREVVLKTMHARKALESGMADSFKFLAESVARYKHPGIAKIFTADIFEGVPYYTMEWIPGTPLRLWLMERLNFENRVLPGVGIIRSLLEIFETIHEYGCYGCLKPENIFITLNGPVLTDFGVVGFLTPQEFEFNAYARRYISYMAPELRQDWSNLLPQSDIYSLGALLYEILVGRTPAPQLRLPSELSPIFGIDADEIILKSMAANATDRFGTVEAFKLAVESLLASLLTAQPPTGLTGLPTVAKRVKPDHSHLDVVSDVQAVHNPDLTFSVPLAAPIQTPEGRSGKRENIEFEAGDRTLFYPNPAISENQKLLADLDAMGDKIIEEAHANRSFAHKALTPLPSPSPEDVTFPNQVESEAVQALQSLERLPDTSPLDTDFEESEARSLPASLWLAIALAGLVLVTLSAYFGITLGR